MQEGQIQELLDNFNNLNNHRDVFKATFNLQMLKILAQKESNESKQNKIMQQKNEQMNQEEVVENKKIFKIQMKNQIQLKQQQKFDLKYTSFQPKVQGYYDEYQTKLTIKCNHINYKIYYEQQKKSNLNVSNLLDSDKEFIENLVNNVFLTLKVAKYYLNYEYLKGFKEFPDRYFAIEQKLINSLNEEKNMELILQDYMSIPWRDFILGLFNFSKVVFLHLFALNQFYSENQTTETIYLSTFKEAILNHIHNQKLVVEGVRAFIRLRWFKAIKISMKTFGSQSFLLDILLDETTTNKINDMKNLKLDEGQYKDTESAAKFYILMLSKYHQLYDPLFKNYSQFSQSAKDYIIEKLPILLEKHDIPEDYLISLLRSSYINDKDVKFVYKIMDYSPQLKVAKPSKLIVSAFNRFVVNYQKEQQVFRFLEHFTTHDLEVVFPVLSGLQHEQLRFFIEKLFQVNRILIQTYLVRLHLEPIYNPQNTKMTHQIKEFIEFSLQMILKSSECLKQQEVLNVLQYLSKQFLVSPSICSTLLFTIEKHNTSQVIEQITEFVKLILRKEAYLIPDVQQGLIQLFSLDSKHFHHLKDLLPQDLLTQI